MTAREIVARATSRPLSPKEQAVADFYAEHREEGAFLSAAEIAERLGTSDATVVRAVKALGYSGIPELRRELIDALLRARATPAVRLGRSLEDVGEDPLGQVLDREIELLEEARSVDRAEFARAAGLLASADRVLIFGLGPSGALAEYFALRLLRIGRPARAITASGLRLADALLDARRGDALLLMAYEPLDTEADAALTRANEFELPVVLLGDTLGDRLSGRVGCVLATRRGRHGTLGSAAATIVLLDALLLALAVRDRTRALAALGDLNRLRRRLRAEPLAESLV
jgi:DNA-binding MurR/RpiR family transcriptional regulator